MTQNMGEMETMTNNIQLYKKVDNLRTRLELNPEHTAKQIAEAIKLVNAINELLDRRKK